MIETAEAKQVCRVASTVVLSVGATAAVERLLVLIANVDHFERMDDVSVVDWTSF